MMEASQTTVANPEITESLSLVEFDAESGSFQATYDSARDSASLAVVAVVAAALGEDPQNLTPLQTVIETDALERLATGSATGLGAPVSVSFEYDGFEVTVTGEGVVEASPLENK